MAVIVLTTFVIIRNMYGIEYAGAFAFIALVATQWANAIGYRSFKYSFWSRKKAPNYKLLVTFAIAVFMQFMVLFVWQPLLSIPENLPLGALGIVIAVSLVVPMTIMEIQKRFTQKTVF
jgi:magnesium-transporting ATPase (P-type)